MALNDGSLSVPNNSAITATINQPNGTSVTGITPAWQTYLTAVKAGLYTLQSANNSTQSELTTLSSTVGTLTTTVSSLATTVGQNTPPGVIQAYAGSSAPAGWLLCNGSTVSTTTYANLYSVIGYTYGGSAGSMVLPNLQGCTIIGVGTLSGNTYTLAGTGGSASATLSTTNLPAHTHSYTGGTTQATSGTYGFAGTGNPSFTTSSQTSGSTGSGSAFSIMSPYLVLNYIIKY